MLEDGRERMAEEIFAVAKSKDISERTVNEAKRKIPNVKSRKVGKNWAWSIPE